MSHRSFVIDCQFCPDLTVSKTATVYCFPEETRYSDTPETPKQVNLRAKMSEITLAVYMTHQRSSPHFIQK